MARVAESALCEREDLDRPDREHEDLLWEDIEFIVVVKAAVVSRHRRAAGPPDQRPPKNDGFVIIRSAYFAGTLLLMF